MLKSLRDHFKKIFIDKQMAYIFIAAICFTICHVYMFIDSGYMIEPLIRICYCGLFFVMALIFGRKWMPLQFLVIAFSVMYFNRWYNPISFLLVAAVALKYPKWKIVLFVVYGIAVIICLAISNRNWAHGFLHYGYCAGVYLICVDIRREFRSKEVLILTESEKEILEQLKNRKLKKEITGYSKNTVTQKIKDAMERNNCSTEGELMCKFKEIETKLI